MNDRIFELAKQADLIQWDSLPSGARTPDHESVAKARKFAELIVQECIETVGDMYSGFGDHCDFSAGADDALQDAITAIKQKFGVEQ